jgi:2-phospho-L-lactate guanylyltransferase
MRTAAVIPVKRFAAAKQRLDPSLDSGAREALAEAMLVDVLDAVARCRSLDLLVVVTGEARAEAAGRHHGAVVVADPADRGHPEAAVIGIDRATEAGARRAALLPGDCPMLDPEELDRLLGRAPEPGVTIVPDRHGTGTNALVLSPPDAIRPAFGPGSCERHRLLAGRAGASCAVEPVESLALDVDTPDDLEAMRAVLRRDPHRAPRTAAALAKATALRR